MTKNEVVYTKRESVVKNTEKCGEKRGASRVFLHSNTFFILFIFFIYKIRHQQNKDKIDNIKNTKAGAVHREELQLRDPNINRTQHNTHYNSTTHI